MRLFSRLLNMVMGWAEHRHASYYLAGLSFAESSFFPIPPDVMLAPMTLAKPERAWQFATVTTLASVAGGVAGYLIGMFAFELVEPLLHSAGYWERYLATREWFAVWGVWVVFLAGFSPIPYKIFTICAVCAGLNHRPGRPVFSGGVADAPGWAENGAHPEAIYRPHRLATGHRRGAGIFSVG